MPTSVRLVVPCWNETKRFDAAAWREGLDSDPALSLTFVDDGSTDGTREVLEAFARERPERAEVVALAANVGKGEAVRAGLLVAIERRPTYTGWWDVDLATPLVEVAKFRDVLERRPGAVLAMGSRVLTLNARIERRALRHYAGRIVATRISRTLRLPIYDTQCGAKLLRVANWPTRLLDEPFLTRWLFDVEVLARLERRHRRGEGAPPEELVVEVPLSRWADIAGSKVRPLDFFRAFVDLRRIRRHYGIGGRRLAASSAPRA